jgi:hypothetical protein
MTWAAQMGIKFGEALSQEEGLEVVIVAGATGPHVVQEDS